MIIKKNRLRVKLFFIFFYSIRVLTMGVDDTDQKTNPPATTTDKNPPATTTDLSTAKANATDKINKYILNDKSLKPIQIEKLNALITKINSDTTTAEISIDLKEANKIVEENTLSKEKKIEKKFKTEKKAFKAEKKKVYKIEKGKSKEFLSNLHKKEKGVFGKIIFVSSGHDANEAITFASTNYDAKGLFFINYSNVDHNDNVGDHSSQVGIQSIINATNTDTILNLSIKYNILIIQLNTTGADEQKIPISMGIKDFATNVNNHPAGFLSGIVNKKILPGKVIIDSKTAKTNNLQLCVTNIKNGFDSLSKTNNTTKENNKNYFEKIYTVTDGPSLHNLVNDSSKNNNAKFLIFINSRSSIDKSEKNLFDKLETAMKEKSFLNLLTKDKILVATSDTSKDSTDYIMTHLGFPTKSNANNHPVPYITIIKNNTWQDKGTMLITKAKISSDNEKTISSLIKTNTVNYLKTKGINNNV